MNDDRMDNEELEDNGVIDENGQDESVHSDYKPVDRCDASAGHPLSGGYKYWFH